MKSYKQILEAVNRGIQLALDDFDNEEQAVQHIKSKQTNHRDYTKEYLDLMEDVVDLELPSGTLWCKYNLDVDPNQLTKAKDWYGGYYAWGELKANKLIYGWNNYKYGEYYGNLTKYCNDPKYGLKRFTDNLTELQPEDDRACQNKKLHNFKFHIPTKEQYEELINYTNSYWVKNYNPNKTVHEPKDDGGIKGLNGRIFEGKNGNQLFIPATGYYNGSNISFIGSHGFAWSSSLYIDNPNSAYLLYFYSDSMRIFDNTRCYGRSVRPVINLR